MVSSIQIETVLLIDVTATLVVVQVLSFETNSCRDTAGFSCMLPPSVDHGWYLSFKYEEPWYL